MTYELLGIALTVFLGSMDTDTDPYTDSDMDTKHDICKKKN